jgi:hypothetical protein
LRFVCVLFFVYPHHQLHEQLDSPLPAGCSVVPNTQRAAPGAALNASYYLDCSPAGGSLAAFGVVSATVNLFIEDVSITQRGTGIPLVYPQVNYTVAARDNAPVFVDWGPVTVDAYEAALVPFPPPPQIPPACAH